MTNLKNLFDMSNEELIKWFRAEILEAEPDPEWRRRLAEYHQKIERDFQEEWSKKRCKWFFTKRRQKKLRYKITQRYSGPVFWLIEDALDDLWPQAFEHGFGEFIDVKNIVCETPNDSGLDVTNVIHTSSRTLRTTIANEKEHQDVL
jgi:hypothetical protein